MRQIAGLKNTKCWIAVATGNIHTKWDAMRIISTVNEPRLTCSLFLSKLICSPVIGILIHLSTLKIWVSQGGLFISTYNKQICKLFYQRRKALGQSGVPVLRLAAAEDKADSETVPSLKENGTTAPITKYSNPDFARIGRVQVEK